MNKVPPGLAVMLAAVADSKDEMFTVTVKLFAAQFEATVVVAMGERHTGLNAISSPPRGDFAGAAEVNRIALALLVPASGVNHVSAPVPTSTFFTWVGKLLLVPRRPTCGCKVVMAFRAATDE